MLARLATLAAKGKFLDMLFPDCMYEMICPSVEFGGEGVHEDYHLRLTKFSDLKDAIASFPPLPLPLKTVAEVPGVY